MPVGSVAQFVPKGLPKRHLLIGLVAIACYVLLFAYYFKYGERIQHNGGLGWDGAAYADWAQRDTIKVFLSKTISEYYVGRILPSFIVHVVSAWIGYDLSSTTHVIHAFFILDVLALCGGVLLLFSIAKHLHWRSNITYVAVAGLLFNYPVLTNLSYNPTLTDMSGYMLGLAIIRAHLRRNLASLWIVSFLCGFVWPTMIYGSLFLIAFGNCQMELRPTPKHGRFIALGAGLALLALSAWLYFVDGLRQTNGTTPIQPALLPLCAILYVAYVYFAAFPLIDVPAQLRSLRQIGWKRPTLAVGLVLSVKLISHHFSDGTPGPLTILSYIGLLTQATLANPLVNVVAHAMHYGPLFIVALLIWPQIAACARSDSLGLTLFMLLFAVLSIGCESRQYLNAWPALVVLTCHALNKMNSDYRIDWWFTYSIALMGIILSRCWLTINVGPWTGNFQQFPDQMLYMYSGPWMSNQMYLVFLAATVLSSVAIATLLRKKDRLND